MDTHTIALIAQILLALAGMFVWYKIGVLKGKHQK
jgi:hypothetical protein